MARMELRHLAMFVAVAEEASFTRAADRVHVVQSAVSASVRGLERELGVELFHRTTHRVELSDAGSALLPEARRTLAAAAIAREVVDEVSGGLRGRIRLGTMQGQVMRAVNVPALLAAFRATRPAVAVEVRHGGGSNVMAQQIREGRLDLAFLSLPERSSPGLTLTPLAAETVRVACAPGHRLAGRAAVELSELADETFAEHPEGWGTRAATDRSFVAARVRRRVTYELNDTATLVEFVRHGLAIALIPPSLAGSAEGLSFVPVRHHAPVFRTLIAAPSDRPIGGPARALLELATQ
jgi:DNA-binding transcriptional LysR family regulator